MKISSLPCQPNVIAISVSELYRHWFCCQNFAISDILLTSWCRDSQAANPRLIASIVMAGLGNVWRVLASLVTEGLQLRASNIIARSSRAVDFASLVSVAYVMCELYALFRCSTQRERTIVFTPLNSTGACSATCISTHYLEMIKSVLQERNWQLS